MVSSYLDVETTKGSFFLLNPTPLDCITGFIMKNDICDRYLKGLSHRSLNFIDGYI